MTAELLSENFGDLPAGRLTEAELLAWLTDRVTEMMEDRRDYLMSLCYTLDLAERDVANALNKTAPASAPALARLLYERQIARTESKRTYQTAPIDDADAW